MIIRISFIYRFVFVFFVLLGLSSCSSNQEKSSVRIIPKFTYFEEDSIIEEAFEPIYTMGLNTQQRRDALDSIIDVYPSIAYFYQQRAMPLYKENKDELGLPFLEKAAALNPEKYLDYMGFMKCIFSKEYAAAIHDFENALELSGEAYVMDHTYYFYIGISYLQLNDFEQAVFYLERSITQTIEDGGGDRGWVHSLDLMYLGIAHLELRNCEAANRAFNESLEKYPSFGDVKYYKAICLSFLGEMEASRILFAEAKIDLQLGNTINEDNAIYEQYPYQIRETQFR